MSEDLLGPLLGDMDGASIALRRKMLPDDADELQVLRAFSVLCGAAAACAARFHDEVDFGGRLTEQERSEWGALVHILMRMADESAVGSDQAELGEVTGALRYAAQVFGEGEGRR